MLIPLQHLFVIPVVLLEVKRKPLWNTLIYTKVWMTENDEACRELFSIWSFRQCHKEKSGGLGNFELCRVEEVICRSLKTLFLSVALSCCWFTPMLLLLFLGILKFSNSSKSKSTQFSPPRPPTHGLFSEQGQGKSDCSVDIVCR